MLPPVSTRNLLTAIETKRREEAALRWSQALPPNRTPATPSRSDTASARSSRS
jgi:hypothetical protein